MEIETLFTEQKWKILSALSKGKFSPLQLAERSNTTMANISQQLKLLEFSNLVKKEKIRNRDKGKPRTLFSLSDDHAYLISAAEGFADKRLLKLDEFHKIMIRVLFLENQELHYYVEKFIWGIEEYLGLVDVIAIVPGKEEIKVIISGSNTKDIEKKIQNTTIKGPKNASINFKIKVLSSADAEKLVKQKAKAPNSEIIYPIYDPKKIFSKLMDGGDS